MNNWQDSYPLSTFTGETKKELVDFITRLLDAKEVDDRLEVQEDGWTKEYGDGFHAGYALGKGKRLQG